MVKFLRRDCARFSKFGNGRGKKAKWRAPKGRDNKMREKIKGHPAVVSIGYRSDKTSRDLIKEKTPVTVMNVADLSKIGKEQIGYLGKVGKKKKLEIMTKAKEMKVEFANANVEVSLKKLNTKEKKEWTYHKKRH